MSLYGPEDRRPACPSPQIRLLAVIIAGFELWKMSRSGFELGSCAITSLGLDTEEVHHSHGSTRPAARKMVGHHFARRATITDEQPVVVAAPRPAARARPAPTRSWDSCDWYCSKAAMTIGRFIGRATKLLKVLAVRDNNPLWSPVASIFRSVEHLFNPWVIILR